MDVHKLQAELDSLREQRAEARQKLDAFRRGPARAPPPPDAEELGFADRRRVPAAGPGAFPDRNSVPEFPASRGADRFRDRPFGAPSPRDAPGGPPAHGSVFARLAGGLNNGPGARGPAADVLSPREPGDRPVERRGAHFDHDDRDRGMYRRDRGPRPWDVRGDNGPVEPLSSPAAASRRKVMSSVVSAAGAEGSNDNDDNKDAQGEAADEPGVGSKRPAGDAGEQNSSSRKRNKRLFGALLGTLQRFNKEEQQFQSTNVAQRRAEMLKKAEEREREESERLRRVEVEERAVKRGEHLQQLGELALATDVKVLELIYAKRIAHKQQLHRYLVTIAEPRLFWQPAEHNASTKAVEEQQQKEVADWQAATLAELEKEKEALRARSVARRDAALARQAARVGAAAGAAAAGVALPGGGAAAMEEADAADERELAAGEYGGVDVDMDGAAAPSRRHPGPSSSTRPQQAAEQAEEQAGDDGKQAGDGERSGGAKRDRYPSTDNEQEEGERPADEEEEEQQQQASGDEEMEEEVDLEATRAAAADATTVEDLLAA